MKDLNEELGERLRSLGVDVRFRKSLPTVGPLSRAIADFSRRGATQRFEVLAGPAVRTADVATVDRGAAPQFVFTEYVPESTGDALRRAEVGYLDRAGNAWISFGAVLIDIRGRRRVGTKARRASQGNLFSRGNAQVVLALLAWPSLWEATRRDVARAAGVSLGTAHGAMALLDESGFGPTSPRRRSDELLDLWAAAYPTALAPSLLLGQFHGVIDHLEPAQEGEPVYVSGEAAVRDLITSTSLLVYVPKFSPRLALANRWRSDGPPNIVVRRSFWLRPDAPEMVGGGPATAPWPVVYADLLASTDPRVRATAGKWKDRHAGSSAGF